MKISTRLVAAGFSGLILLAEAGIANSAEVKVLSANGMREVMEDLGPKFESATGYKLAITYGTLGAIVKRVRAGESADVIIIPRQGIESFVKDGRVAPQNVSVVARSSIGVAVRKGIPKPDISSPEALKRALLAANSLTYVNPAGGGASGTHFAKVLDDLGIAENVKTKTVFPKPPDPVPVAVGALVANGETDIVVLQFQQLISIPGVEIVGPLPAELQYTIVFAAAIMDGAKAAEASKALIDFLRAPEASAVIRAKGMEPG